MRGKGIPEHFLLDLEESGVFLCEHCGAFFRNCHDEMFSVVVFEYPLFSPLFVVVSEYFLFSFVVSDNRIPFFRFVARQQNSVS